MWQYLARFSQPSVDLRHAWPLPFDEGKYNPTIFGELTDAQWCLMGIFLMSLAFCICASLLRLTNSFPGYTKDGTAFTDIVAYQLAGLGNVFVASIFSLLSL
jgi:hypothetical protein